MPWQLNPAMLLGSHAHCAAQRFRGYNALRSLRVGAMAIAASFKTNVAQAKKFYFEDPDIVPAKDCPEHDEVWRAAL